MVEVKDVSFLSGLKEELDVKKSGSNRKRGEEFGSCCTLAKLELFSQVSRCRYWPIGKLL